MDRESRCPLASVGDERILLRGYSPESIPHERQGHLCNGKGCFPGEGASFRRRYSLGTSGVTAER